MDDLLPVPGTIAEAAQRSADKLQQAITVWERTTYAGRREFSWTTAGEAQPNGFSQPKVFQPVLTP